MLMELDSRSTLCKWHPSTAAAVFPILLTLTAGGRVGTLDTCLNRNPLLNSRSWDPQPRRDTHSLCVLLSFSLCFLLPSPGGFQYFLCARYKTTPSHFIASLMEKVHPYAAFKRGRVDKWFGVLAFGEPYCWAQILALFFTL